MIFGEEHTIYYATTPLNCNILVRTAIEELKLGYIIIPIAATPFQLSAFENSHWKWIYLRWLFLWSHFDGVAWKPNILGSIM